jgi:uncharacterized phosphosugar-binding protein
MFMPKVVRIDVDVASSQKNKGFVVTTCMTSVNPAKNTPQRMAQTKQVRPNRCLMPPRTRRAGGE